MKDRIVVQRWLLVVVVILASTGVTHVQEDAAATARQILAETGVQGGLVVHLDCGDGRLTAALRPHEGFLVHGLARTAKDVQEARSYLSKLGLYGPVSVDRWDGRRLPYADNLVNLVVGTEKTDLDKDEIQRVLAPGGVAFIRHEGRWTKTVKPRPSDIDEWTHYLHDADGNPVAHDKLVGPPRRLQWVGSPRWARHHDHMASMTSLVSAGGRLFYIFDEGPTASIQLPASWRLIARDAFNGTILWKREIDSWNTHQWPLKSGPAHLTRRLVALRERVYVTLGLEAPVTALDAASGKMLLKYENSERTREILVSDGVLLALVGREPSELPDWRRRDSYVWDNTRRANADWAWAGATRRIAAYDAQSGRALWRAEAPVAPCSLAADAGHVIFYDGQKVVCLGHADGKPLWESKPIAANLPVLTSTGPRTLLYNGVVLFAGNNGLMTALSPADGRKLWEGKQFPSGHQSLRDLMVVGGLVWSAPIAGGGDSGVFTGRDPLTGEVKSQFPPDIKTYWFHHRCYPSKATDQYVLTSRTGVEFVDPKAQHWETHHWVRGGCIYGVLPCNGLLYAPMHSCGCYLEAKLNGFNALAPGPVVSPTVEDLAEEARLQRGPAYGDQAGQNPSPADWPTYRRDAARSGATPAQVPVELKQAWKTQLGGRLTAPVVTGGRVFVASIDTHTVHALDAQSGRLLWSGTAGGRIDSPPTVYRGLVLFGSADGYVYALRAADGQLAWRFRAAPLDRRMVAFEQLESTWPVHGSVLVHDGVLYCTAGRSIFLDGGIRFLKLDAVTGRKMGEVVWDDRDPETGENMQVHVSGLNMPVALSDVLSCDGRYLYMRSQRIDFDGRRLEIPVAPVEKQYAEDPHLFCQIGFLDDSWFHRSYWTYGRRVTGGYGGWLQAGRYVPAGRILVFDQDHVYGYGRKPQYFVNTSVLEYQLFSADKQVAAEAAQRVRAANGLINARSDKQSANASDWKVRRGFPVEDLTATHYQWILDQPALQVRALLAAGDNLFMAGYADVIDERRAFRLPDDPEVHAQLQRQAEALQGRQGGLLWVASKAEGRPLARYHLQSPPVFDGLAATAGRLLLSTLDGSVLCLAGEGFGLHPEKPAEPVQVISDEPEEPDYLKPPEVDKSADFDRVIRCRVVESDLGYRLRPTAAKQACLVLKRLPTPLIGTIELASTLRVRRAQGSLVNGFLVFGDGPSDARLVKCGIRFQPQKALIVQGSLTADGKSKGADVKTPIGKPVDLRVEVDLLQQKVTFTVGGTTVEAELDRPLKSVTHVGYCSDRAVAEFSPLKIGT
jgi:outer membrane protein assembly factor BamB